MGSKTVIKWKRRASTSDAPMGRHRPIDRPKPHGVSRLPEIEGEKPPTKKFKCYPIRFVHIDIAEVRIEEGKLFLFIAIERISKLVFAR